MYVIRHVDEIPTALKGAVVAIGNFDGVHLGHQALLAHAKEKAITLGKPLMVLTFEPHPRRLFRPDLPYLNLLSFKEKIKKLESQGVDAVYAIRFSRTFSNIRAEQFIETILHRFISASYVVTGSDFVFGHARGGNAQMLKQYAEQGLFGYTAFSPLERSGVKYSSSHIRTALSEGKPELASAALGEPYSMQERVIHGDKRGRTFGFPTANLRMPARFLPKFGIYAVRAEVQSEQAHPAKLHGVANLGIRPMYHTDTPLMEVHLFDFNGDLYGKWLRVELVEYIRPEKIFTSEAALIEQMHEDASRARSILHEHSVSIPTLRP